MSNSLPALLSQLENHRIKGLDIGENTIHPYYEGYSLSNIPASICHWLNVPTLGNPPLVGDLLDLPSGPFRSVVILLVDGLGLKWFQKFLQSQSDDWAGAYAWQQIMPEACLGVLTSVVPSTTSTALTTLWTGRNPAEHGILGYELWLKEFGVVANMITHSPITFQGDSGSLKKANFQPEVFLPVPTLGTHLLQYNVKTYALMHTSIVHSGLSAMHLQDTNAVAFHVASDMMSNVRDLLADRTNERTYIWAYWGVLDELFHHYGPDDERPFLEFNTFSIQLEYFLRRLIKKGHKDTLFILTADHGFISTPPYPQYKLANHPKFMSLLTMLPTGEARLPFLFLRSGREKQALEYIESTWQDKFCILKSEQALDLGLFGKGHIYPRTVERIGDWTIIPQGNAYWWWANKENTMQGRHGGLSPEEMLVPFLAMVI